ncbi:hypothetical protein F5144DRAFT_624630 [Chaetomium tenue]|uniref:Uncharacterized protein n=1 Tax=Chaetomium tenue TaxID=1854479 RepID=A0ACB7PQ51_9PEZI|nr:hypothetical protein F5144DRAFT_624630 [Chaetomium globosum]
MDPRACSNCGRTSSSVLALGRHQLRCRSRPRGRKKACAECSRSKVRCDQGLPTCSRCAIHHLLCAYREDGSYPGSSSSHPRMVSLSTLVEQTPLTPSLTPPDTFWTSATDRGPDLTNSRDQFSAPGWVSDATWDWQERLFASDQGQGCVESSAANVTPERTLVANNSQGVTQSSADNDFQCWPVYGAEKWANAKQGLDLIDHVLKSYVDGVAQGLRPGCFIHHHNWGHDRRPLVLVEATAVAHLYATATPQSYAVLLRSINTQLASLQRNITTQTRADDVSMMQAVLLYAMMCIYRSGPTASEGIDRVPLRLMQHVLSKNMHCIPPHTNVTSSDWESWIQNETLRRCFLTLHALDHVTHARQSLPGALCALFPDSPLPCPPDVWEAPTAEVWAARHRAWEDRCAPDGPVRAGEVLGWVWGQGAGRGELVRRWFEEAGEGLGGVVWECARAQARVGGGEGVI